MTWTDAFAHITWTLLVEAAVVAALGLVLAVAAAFFVGRLLSSLAQRTETELDDIVVGVLRWPVGISAAAVGLYYALFHLRLPEPLPYITEGVLVTLCTLVWAASLARGAARVITWLAAHRERYHTLVTARTMPVFDLLAKTVIYVGSAYFVLLAWDVDVTGWLASAGILGVAIGFASQDTLSNLIAGVFILADAPYKLGDMLLLDSGVRGEVIEIGIRTTRLMTRDDVEIVVPNKVMANAVILNESGGKSEAYRVRVQVGVSYDVDIDHVHSVLMEVAAQTDGVEREPEPRVRFRAFGDSSLNHELLVWVARPVLRGLVSHQLHTSILKRFRQEGIEIPFPQRVLHRADTVDLD